MFAKTAKSPQRSTRNLSMQAANGGLAGKNLSWERLQITTKLNKSARLRFTMKKWLTKDGVVLGWYNSKSLLYTPKHWQSTSFMEDENHNLTNFCMCCQFVVSYHLRDYKNIEPFSRCLLYFPRLIQEAVNHLLLDVIKVSSALLNYCRLLL